MFATKLTILVTEGVNDALPGVELLLLISGEGRELVHFILEEFELKCEEYNDRKKNSDKDDGKEHEGKAMM